MSIGVAEIIQLRVDVPSVRYFFDGIQRVLKVIAFERINIINAIDIVNIVIYYQSRKEFKASTNEGVENIGQVIRKAVQVT